MTRATRKISKKPRYLLQTYWSGPPLSLLEKLCLESWTRFGARVDLFTHDSVTAMREQIPVAAKPYITVINADVIVDRSKKFDYAGGHKSKRSDAFKALPFSDLFRYELLRKRGGVWMDFDIVLIRPIPARLFKAPYFFVSERTMQAGAYKSKETSKPTNACIYARDPNSTWANDIGKASEGAVVDSAWTFMKIFQASLTPELHRYIQPPEFIMPVNWWDLDGLFVEADRLSPTGCLKAKYGVQQTCATILKNPKTVGIHLFRGLLRKRDLPYEDEAQIPPSSLLGRIISHVRGVITLTRDS
jgi:hypothetical protein